MASPRKPSGMTPTISCGAPLITVSGRSPPIALEQLAPSRVTQHDHRPAGALVVWQQRASERRLDPEHLEEVSADDDVGSRETALDAGRAGIDREGIREDAGLAAQRLVVAPREDDGRFAAPSVPCPIQTANSSPGLCTASTRSSTTS